MYLRRNVKTEDAQVFAENFLALSWLYPGDPYLRLAGAKAYMQKVDGDKDGEGLILLQRISESAPAWMKIALMETIIPFLQRHFYSQLYKSPGCAHLMQYNWKAPTIFSEFDESLRGDLHKFIVLTRVFPKDDESLKETFFRADRVEDFVSETWGDQGRETLTTFQKLLDEVLREPKKLHIRRQEDTTSPITYFATPAVIAVSALCFPEGWNQFVQCLLWIDEVVGCPQTQGLHRNERLLVRNITIPRFSVLVDQIQLEELHNLINLHPEWLSYHVNVTTTFENWAMQLYTHASNDRKLELVVDNPDQSCWTALVERSYVGIYSLPFPKIPGNIGQGLRVPFDILYALAGIERIITGEDGGIILAGFCTVLVPIKVVNEKDRSIQWHLVIQRAKGTRFRSIHNWPDFWNLLPKQRLCEKSLDNLRGIAWVGWCESIEFKLGTQANPPSLGYTNLSSTKYRWELNQRGLSLGVQAGLPNSLALIAAGQLTQKKAVTTWRLLPQPVLGMRLAELFRTTVFIYDEQRKTAWLCPQILLILHLLRLDLKRLGHESVLDTITFPITCVNEQIQHHSQALQDILCVRIEGASYSYGDIITRLTNRFEEAFANLVHVQRRTPYDDMLGFELKDILHSGRKITPKTLPVKGSIKKWSALADMGDLVFCTGLGDAISIAGNCGQSCINTMTPIPNHNILVCPLYLLKEMLIENGCCIDGQFACVEKSGEDGYKWEVTGNPFQCNFSNSNGRCDTTTKTICWANRLQHVIPARKLRRIISKGIGDRLRTRITINTVVQVPRPESIPTMTGAICFGKIKNEIS